MIEVLDRPSSTRERIAEQILIGFSDSLMQEPIEGFTPEGDGEINLTAYHPGTIFRLEYLDLAPDLETGNPSNKGPQYSWYVVGDRARDPQSGDEKVFVYSVTLSGQADNSPTLLRSTGALAIAHEPIPLTAFPVRDAKYALEGHDLVKERFEEIFPVRRVDIMAMGLNLDQTRPLEVVSPERRLN